MAEESVLTDTFTGTASERFPQGDRSEPFRTRTAGELAERVLPWLRWAREHGIDVLVGDPGRRYLPTGDLVELASHEVRTTTELEDLDPKAGYVYGVR